ncbi:hypothetical protein EYF80_015451 [Liparis tanakae]|uniref:Uncharacterized protein n=1 Tax=Liparis tanakae TaxID=230148 RepID=A0A4Z2I8T8_9TELE|nr:hypothetical protein EYF80_015451 [Liparis tanakae]
MQVRARASGLYLTQLSALFSQGFLVRGLLHGEGGDKSNPESRDHHESTKHHYPKGLGARTAGRKSDERTASLSVTSERTESYDFKKTNSEASQGPREIGLSAISMRFFLKATTRLPLKLRIDEAWSA